MKKIKGFFTWECLYRDMVLKFPSGSHFVEVGVFQGQSLYYLIQEIIKSRKDISVTAVDWFKNQSENLLRRFMSNLFKVQDKFNVIVDESCNAAKQFEDGSLDFVFIDASHSYENVRKDIIAWLPKVKVGGILAGHDYGNGYEGVIQAVDEIFGNKVNKEYIKEQCWLVVKE